MGGPASALGLIRARFSARLSPAWRGFRGGLNWLYKVLDGSTTAIWQDLSRLHGHRHNVGQQVAFLELVGLLKAKTIKQLLCKLEGKMPNFQDPPSSTSRLQKVFAAPCVHLLVMPLLPVRDPACQGSPCIMRFQVLYPLTEQTCHWREATGFHVSIQIIVCVSANFS